MTEIKFYFNVDSKLVFACKLAKKAYDGGRKLMVYAPDEGIADRFDRELWTFSQLSFVPHVKSHHPLAAQTPVVITRRAEELVHHEALLNLGDDPPAFFSRFEQLREVVGVDAEDRSLARERLRFYKSRGFEISTEDIAAR
jgi:DNA polymerase-3 subunit chi